MVEILCTAFSYKELYKNCKIVVKNLVFYYLGRFINIKSYENA